jgi:hypothetical protein
VNGWLPGCQRRGNPSLHTSSRSNCEVVRVIINATLLFYRSWVSRCERVFSTRARMDIERANSLVFNPALLSRHWAIPSFIQCSYANSESGIDVPPKIIKGNFSRGAWVGFPLRYLMFFTFENVNKASNLLTYGDYSYLVRIQREGKRNKYHAKLQWIAYEAIKSDTSVLSRWWSLHFESLS